MSDGTEFTIDIPVKAGGVEAAASAVEVLAARLEAASKASAAASGAVSAADKSYSSAEKSADQAAKALERVGVAIEAQKSKLKAAGDSGNDKAAQSAAAKLQALVEKQSQLAARAAAAKSALQTEAAALDKLKAAATSAEAAETKLSKEMDQLKKAEKEAGAAGKEAGEGFRFEPLERGLGKIGGPLGSSLRTLAGLGSGFTKLEKSLGSAGAAALTATLAFVALAAALVAVSAAAVVGIAKIAEWAVKLGDANAHALLLSQGIARTVAGGDILNDRILKLTKTLPFTQEELQEMAKKLADSGLRGKELANALDKAAVKAATLKFGPNFAREMLTLDQQSKVFQQNLAETFGGLKLDGLLKGMQLLIALFDKNTASGHALKTIFESLFQPLVDWIAKQAPKIERFFIQLEIMAIKALIAIKPHGHVFTDIGNAALKLIPVLEWMAQGFFKGVVGLVQLADQIDNLLKKTAAFGSSVGKAFESLKSLSLAGIGKAMIDGLVQGIEAGGSAILSALKGAVMGAVEGVKGLLGIKSPSKVFAEIGMQTGAGMEEGVGKSAPRVRGSLEDMVQPPSMSGKPSGAAQDPNAGGKSGGGHNLAGAQFHFYGVQGAEDAIEKFRETLTRVLEGDVAQLGAATVAPANT